MKKNILSILFILYSFIGSAQHMNDTIVVYIDNQLELQISIEDYDHLRDSNEISAVLTEFQTFLIEMSDKLNSETADFIKYNPDSSIVLEKGEQTTIFLIEKGKIRNTGSRDVAVIKLNKTIITLTARDLSAIEKISLADCYEKMLLLLPEKSRYSRKLYYQCNQGNITAIEEKNEINNLSGIDVIELNAGVGVSIVKNQLVGDFTFKLNFGFRKKGINISHPYTSLNLMYDFSDGNRMHINTFLNVGHNWTIPKKLDQSALIGLELGYLISKNGELFEDNTFRFGVNYALPSGFRLSPQLYMGNDFKQFYPGIRLEFLF